MSVDTETAVYLEPASGLSVGGFAPLRPLRRLLRGAVRFFESIRAAQIVVRRAERYYAMSDLERARIGLTRRDVPAELLRVLTGHQRD